VATLVCAFLLGAGASTAAASGPPAPGVHIDPGSPVAKEYAIPLAQARAGSGSSGGQLFGKGITPAQSTTPAPVTPPPAAAAPAAEPATETAGGVHAARHAHRAAGHHPGARRRARPTHRAADRGTQVAAATAAPASAELSASSRPSGGGGAGIEWMVGVAALVLALGGLGGAVLARHSRSASTPTS
jgi:hypothetical protein